MKKSLEKIVNGIKQFRKKAIAVGVTLAMLYSPAYAAEGVLYIKNMVDGKALKNDAIAKRLDDPRASDGKDVLDTSLVPPIGEGSGAYFWLFPYPPFDAYEIEATPDESDKTFLCLLYYNGEIINEPNNWLELSMPYEGYTFGNNPLTITDSNLVYDVKDLIDRDPNGIARIPYGKIENGTYSWDAPYGLCTINTTLFPGDFDWDYYVDEYDLGYLADNWLMKGPDMGADICGPDGKPDGIVNFIDFAKFSSNYGKDFYDPNTW